MDVEKAVGNALAGLITQAVDDLATRIKRSVTAEVGRIKVDLNFAFTNYLSRTYRRCSRIKTLLHRYQPIDIETIYVAPFLTTPGENAGERKKDIILESDVVVNLLGDSRIAITGIAGSGKSMMLRHMFVNMYLYDTHYIPLFIELRNLNNTEPLQLLDFIYQQIHFLNENFSTEQFEYALRAGRFCFLLDGLDEINFASRTLRSREILELSNKFSKTPIMLTSRPDNRFVSWSEFTEYSILPFTFEQVVDLITRIDYDEQTKKLFLHKLKERLFDSHREFLSNPLLATMMLMTFDQFADIPAKMHIFYSQAFDTLFNKHDATKPSFTRKFYCDIASDDFRRLFSAFCTFTYIEQVHSFTENSILPYAANAIRFEDFHVDPKSFINDLTESVSVLIRDGDNISFLHRSFQEYFVASFIIGASPTTSVAIMERLSEAVRADNVFTLLNEMNQDYFERNFVLLQLGRLATDIRAIDEKDAKAFAGLFFSSIRVEDGGYWMSVIIGGKFYRYFPLLYILLQTHLAGRFSVFSGSGAGSRWLFTTSDGGRPLPRGGTRADAFPKDVRLRSDLAVLRSLLLDLDEEIRQRIRAKRDIMQEILYESKKIIRTPDQNKEHNESETREE